MKADPKVKNNKSTSQNETQEQNDDNYDNLISNKSFEELAEHYLKPEEINKLKKIAHYIGRVGLTVQESCLLADVKYEPFKELLQKNGFVGKLIMLKELQYKKDLLATLSNKARDGDDKLATWLLERRYPGEFSKRKPKEDDGTSNVIADALEFIREHGDNAPIVKQENKVPIDVKDADANLLKRISEALS